jgi:hypothetical protein
MSSFLAFIPSHLHIMTVPVFLLLIHLLAFIPTLHQCLFPSLDFCVSLLALMSLFHSLSLLLSPHFCAFIQTFLYSVLLFHLIPSFLLFFLSIVTLFMYSICSMSYGPMLYPFSLIFHIVHYMHCKWFTNPYSTNKCTVLLLCIALLITFYMFWLNCHYHGANNYITKSLQL